MIFLYICIIEIELSLHPQKSKSLIFVSILIDLQSNSIKEVFNKELLKFPPNFWSDYNIQRRKQQFLTHQMHKNISFKIHRQKLTLNNQQKTIKQNLKLSNLQINRCESKRKISCLSGNETSARSLKKSQSLLVKNDEKQNIIVVNPILPSIRAPNIENKDQSSQDPFKGICFLSSSEPVKNLLNALLQSLLKKQLKFQPLKSSFLIQKTYFVNLLEYLFSLPIAKNPTECHEKFQELSLSSSVFEAFTKIWENELADRTKLKLYLNSAIISHVSNHNLWQSGKRQGPNAKETVPTSSNQQSEALRTQQQILLTEKQKLLLQIEQKTSQLNNMDNHLRHLESKSSILKQEITSLENKLAKTKADADQILGYVDTQRNGVLKMVSMQYKQIEADLYDYAAYLQANVMASGLEYEPHPYQEIQKLMKEEFTEISSLKLCTTEMDKESKLQKLIAFGQRVLSFMSKKDGQVGKLLEFKTKCIRTYVKNMKKWLDNWTLKQEYLNNLRIDFAEIADRFRSAYKVLEDAMKESKNCQKFMKDLFCSLMQCFLRMEENYKLGNSFY